MGVKRKYIEILILNCAKRQIDKIPFLECRKNGTGKIAFSKDFGPENILCEEIKIVSQWHKGES